VLRVCLHALTHSGLDISNLYDFLKYLLASTPFIRFIFVFSCDSLEHHTRFQTAELTSMAQ
jgi:hypothetical protein